jgi:hypothetical protein
LRASLIRGVVAATLAAALLLPTRDANAHLSSDSYLRIDIDADGRPNGQWDIALRDLDVAVGLETDEDGVVTWGRLKAKRGAIEAYAFGRLAVDGCALHSEDLLVDRHAGMAYAVLRFRGDCGAAADARRLRYGLLFDIDPTHRGLLTIVTPRGERSEILSPERAEVTLEAVDDATSDAFFPFVVFGVHHILLGYDHLLFLATLLIYVAFRRGENGRWKPLDGFGETFLRALAILTAFTAAHAVTLTLSVLQVVDAPARLVEPAVAITIMAAAIDNVRQILPRARWIVAFGFGLVHGLAFATALGPMRLAPAGMLLALAGFNGGVELGQIAVASLLAPVAFTLRRHRFYDVVVAPALSSIAFLLATAWFVDRVAALR